MWFKPYGTLGLEVSVIGFGGMRFPRAGSEKPEYDLDGCAQVVLEARAQGINYFDTAPFYCDDRSEDIMGHAFRLMRQAGLGAPGLAAPKAKDSQGQGLRPVYISTKSGEHSGPGLRGQLERSLTRLGVEKIDFFNIWCIMNLEDYRARMVKGGAWETVMRAKEEGLVGHVVCSSHCSGAEIAKIAGDRVFEGITLGYNILNWQFRQEGIQAAAAQGMGVITMNPLGGGQIPQQAQSLGFLARTPGQGMVETALEFNATHSEISVVLAGMGNLDEVRQNAAVGHELGRLASAPGGETALAEESRSRRADLVGQMGQAMDSLCTGCQYCLPCPQDIGIPKFMMAYNQSVFGKPLDTLNQMKWHWKITGEEAATCIACGACEARCTQHLPIIARLGEIAGWADAEARAASIRT